MRSPRRRRKRLLDVEDAARTRTVPRGCEAAHWDAHNRRGPFSTAERYSIVDMIDPRRSLSAPTPVSRAEECGRGREGDVAFGDAPITKYHPRGPGLRLVKRYYYTCAGSPRGIGTREYIPPHRELNTTIPYPVYRIRGVALAPRGPRVPLPGRAGSISFGFAQRRLDLRALY